MMMQKVVDTKPQKSFLVLSRRAKRDTKAMAKNTVSTNVRSPQNLSLLFLGYSIGATDINSITPPITPPVPLIVDNNKCEEIQMEAHTCCLF
jgi:hypothetical protein